MACGPPGTWTLRAVDENRKRAFDSKCQTLKSGCYQRLATACPMPQAAQEATACRLRDAGLVLALEGLSDLCSEQDMEGSLTCLQKREVAWQLSSLMEGVCPKSLFWRHVFFPGPPGFCFSVRDLLSVSLFSSSPQFGIFQLIMLELVRGGPRMTFQWNGAASSTRQLLWMNSASGVGLIIFKSRTRLTRFFDPHSQWTDKQKANWHRLVKKKNQEMN